jgi:glycosyltransferase involved in cell wall biosynthesis
LSRERSVITLAVPFHRNVAYLREALVSVREQTCADWVVEVFDDGNEAGAAETVASFQEPRFRYHRVPGQGMAANWNRGLDHATTDLVTLLHADDRLLPTYVATLAAAAAEHPHAAGIFCHAAIIGPTGGLAWSFADWVKGWLRPGQGRITIHGQSGLAMLLRGNFIMCPTMCYRRSRLGARRFAERGWQFAHDFAFFTQLILDGETLVGLPDVAYAYRRHQANTTVQLTRNLRRFHEEIALYDSLARACHARHWERAARVARRKSIIRANLGFCAAQDAVRGEWAASVEKLRLAWQPIAPVDLQC